MLKSMKMVKVLSQLTEEYPHGCNVGKYLMVESWRKLWLHFKLGMIQGGIKKWQEVANLPITLFCIHGNHERRPTTIVEYKLQEWNGGKVWVEEAYPNILFAKDGEIYDIAGMKTIVIGGAYSVDKFYRLSKGYNWFEDEQPSDEIKAYVEKQLSNNDWNVDVVLSHTVPYDYRPVDLFLSMIDQSTVDESTELWLGEIEKKLDYKWWYAGHYHTSRVRDKVQIMFEDIEEFLHRKLDYQ